MIAIICSRSVGENEFERPDAAGQKRETVNYEKIVAEGPGKSSDRIAGLFNTVQQSKGQVQTQSRPNRAVVLMDFYSAKS